MLRKVNATAFVDWQSQISNARQRSEVRAAIKAGNTAEYVVNILAGTLPQVADADYFTVQVRLYHGWHSGLSRSVNRVALDGLVADDLLPKSRGTTTFDWSCCYGDKLMSAYDHRLHPRLGCHLPDTLREDFETGERAREKMVDSAMICDLLWSARHAAADWRLIMAEDDDVVPGAFVSEKWSKADGGKTLILRTRPSNKFLQMTGLIHEISSSK